MTPWASGAAWQAGGENLYRHKDAYYFLPSEDEWYKAAFHKNDGVTANYWDYATGNNTAPTAVASGTGVGTAVYNGVTGSPAAVNNGGGLSAYGTMGQNGNVWEWSESAYDGINDSSSENRVRRGGYWNNAEFFLRSSDRSSSYTPPTSFNGLGFRVASVPEPTTALLLALGMAGVALKRRRIRSTARVASVVAIGLAVSGLSAVTVQAQEKATVKLFTERELKIGDLQTGKERKVTIPVGKMFFEANELSKGLREHPQLGGQQDVRVHYTLSIEKKDGGWNVMIDPANGLWSQLDASSGFPKFVHINTSQERRVLARFENLQRDVRPYLSPDYDKAGEVFLPKSQDIAQWSYELEPKNGNRSVVKRGKFTLKGTRDHVSGGVCELEFRNFEIVLRKGGN